MAKTYCSLGMMSGTSIDGSIDVAILSTDGEDILVPRNSVTFTYENNSGERPIHHLMKAAEFTVRECEGDLARARNEFTTRAAQYFEGLHGVSKGEGVKYFEHFSSLLSSSSPNGVTFDSLVSLSAKLHADAAMWAIKESKMSPSEINVIGYHGQTLYHAPHKKIAIQVGDPQVLADALRCQVVYDFRSNDVAHGGQGAPLAPLYHAALARHHKLAPCVFLNIGGVSNITVIPEDRDTLTAFDTGPGNGLLDRFMTARAGLPFDNNGEAALRGTVQSSVLQKLLEKSFVGRHQNYLQRDPPKSLDFRDFTLIEELASLSVDDGAATLAAFTAECIDRGVRLLLARGIGVPTRWLVMGGGAKNPSIIKALRVRLVTSLASPTVTVESSATSGIQPEFVEGGIFAYLAVRSLRGLPISFPGTTGVPRPLIGGKCVQPGAALGAQ